MSTSKTASKLSSGSPSRTSFRSRTEDEVSIITDRDDETESGTDSEFLQLEIRLKVQNDEIKQLQNQNRKLQDELDQERLQSVKQLKKLEAAAKVAEARIHDLSAELVRSREVGKKFQLLCEQQQNQMHEQSLKDPFDERRRLEMRAQQMEVEAERLREEVKNLNHQGTQQRAAIKKSEEERDVALKLYDASERERSDLRRKVDELQRDNKRQAATLNGTARDWLRKNHQLDAMREDMRWKMIDQQVTYKHELGQKSTFKLPKDKYMPRRLQAMEDERSKSAAVRKSANTSASPRKQQQEQQQQQQQQQQRSRGSDRK